MVINWFVSARLITLDGDQIGIAYETRFGAKGARLASRDDPYLPILRNLLTEPERQELNARLNNVVPFPHHLVRRADSNDKARR